MSDILLSAGNSKKQMGSQPNKVYSEVGKTDTYKVTSVVQILCFDNGDGRKALLCPSNSQPGRLGERVPLKQT